MSENPAVRATLFATLLLAAAAGCGGGEPDPRADIGRPEGRLVLVNWAGHVQDGSEDPDVDWVTSFEQETGCAIASVNAESRRELASMLGSGQHDGATAPDSMLDELAAEGTISPVNLGLLPNHRDLFDDVAEGQAGKVDGIAYGVPHARGLFVVDEPAPPKGGKHKANRRKRPPPKPRPVARPDSWVIASDAEHPNCMYLWLNHTIDPRAHAKAAERLFESPTGELACAQTSDPGYCERVHARDPGFWDRLYISERNGT
jgi:spermidine/putrescine-binding protein